MLPLVDRLGGLVHNQKQENLNLVTRPATEEDALHIERNLRPEDRREVETVSGKVEGMLSVFLSLSRSAYTFRFDNGDPFAIFGVVTDPKHEGYGAVWLLATPEISQAKRSVLREAERWANRWVKYYPKGLHQLVDSRNTLHLRWLKKLGFKTGQSALIRDVPFIYVRKT
jgi:hypothetical protein